jgi:uncharacterized protein
MSAYFEIRTSGIAGKGAFALRHIPAGTRLIEYTGERVSHKEADSRYDDAEEDGSTHVVLFTVDSRTVIDAGVGGNDARFINHSCAPNCQAVIERRRVFIDALRDIAPGEELSYDYEMPREGEDDETARKYWPCHCGAHNCRGTLLLPIVEPKPARRKPASSRKTTPKARKTTRRRKPARRVATGKSKAVAKGRAAVTRRSGTARSSSKRGRAR